MFFLQFIQCLFPDFSTDFYLFEIMIRCRMGMDEFGLLLINLNENGRKNFNTAKLVLITLSKERVIKLIFSFR